MATSEEMLQRTGFEQVQFLRDPATGVRAIVAVHDTRRGPAFGGIRRRRYDGLGAALADVLALAAAMTWKCALADVPAGGGKTVILAAPDADDVPDADGAARAAGYALVGRYVEEMGGRYFTGPDVGTTDDDLRLVCRQTRYCASPDADGPGDLGDSTAQGVFAALVATAAHAGRGIDGLHVVVQGLGAVGFRLARLLRAAGARLSVAEPSAATCERAAAELGATVLPLAAALRTPCDLFAPCALGSVLDVAAARALPALAVCGAANNVLADEAAGAALHARGIPVAPDFVANAGALIHGALWHLTGTAPPPERIDRIGDTVRELLARSRRDDVPPGALALDLARQRVDAAPPGPFLPRRRPAAT